MISNHFFLQNAAPNPLANFIVQLLTFKEIGFFKILMRFEWQVKLPKHIEEIWVIRAACSMSRKAATGPLPFFQDLFHDITFKIIDRSKTTITGAAGNGYSFGIFIN